MYENLFLSGYLYPSLFIYVDGDSNCGQNYCHVAYEHNMTIVLTMCTTVVVWAISGDVL